MPNVDWRFEGKSVRVFARNPIAVGDELFITYAGESIYDFLARRERLHAGWGFDCSCMLCKKGNADLPAGPIRNRMVAHQAKIMEVWKGNLENARELMNTNGAAISEMMDEAPRVEAGFGAWPANELHKFSMISESATGNPLGALRSCLALYYLVEPAQIPPIIVSQKLNTLFNLLQLVTMVGEMKDSEFEGKSKPKAITAVLQLQLREQFVGDTEKCFGVDSKVARYEREVFDDLVAEHEKRSHAKYVMMDGSLVEQEKFKESINELLTWADWPVRL